MPVTLYMQDWTISYDPFEVFDEQIGDTSKELIAWFYNNFEPVNPYINASSNNEYNNTSSGVSIGNPDELATAIAKAIKSLPIHVRTDISDVKLVVNGEPGRRVILTLDN